MAMRIETPSSVFELSDPGTSMYELKKIEDKTPGKRAKFSEGMIIKAKTYVKPQFGLPLILKDETGKVIYNSKELVNKPPTGNPR